MFDVLSCLLVLRRGLRHGLPALALFAASAQAAVYTGIWDPAFGAPFINLGWRGNVSYFVPDACVPVGTLDVNNTPDCAGAAAVTSAAVEFYDVNAGGQPTLDTLVFNPALMTVGTLRFVAGELTELTSSDSNLVSPTANLSAFGVSAIDTFFLRFTLTGPRLGWSHCTQDYSCTGGLNDEKIPLTFKITRALPEPTTLLLSGLALSALLSARRRARS